MRKARLLVTPRYLKLCIPLVMACSLVFYGYAYLSQSGTAVPLLLGNASTTKVTHSARVWSHFSFADLSLITNVNHSQVSNITSHPMVFKRTKVVLQWTPFFGMWKGYIPRGRDGFRNCPVSDCEVTIDRERLPHSDAVLFHVRDLSLTNLPRLRLPHQRWILYSLESPIYSFFGGFRYMKGMFNWTMTYRTDSDIVTRYGGFKKLPREDHSVTKHLYELWKKKSRMAVWMVSHCRTASKRETFVNELQKYIDVDIYGRCGMATCPLNMTQECLKRFEEKYMFVLALENAVCKDYVTEKFFEPLSYKMIPVVLGGSNYDRIAPPKSFIDALSFPSVKELAEHMKRVAKDFEEYSSYLAWKNENVVHRYDDGLCQLCSKLHNESEPPFSYDDLKKWWVDGSNCREWTQGRDLR